MPAKRKKEGGALARFRLGPDTAVATVNDTLHGRQSDTGARAALPQPVDSLIRKLAHVNVGPLHIALGRPCQLQDVIDQFPHALAGGTHPAQVVPSQVTDSVRTIFSQQIRKPVDSSQRSHFPHGVAEVLQGSPRDMEKMQVIVCKQIDLVKRVFEHASPALAQRVAGPGRRFSFLR